MILQTQFQKQEPLNQVNSTSEQRQVQELTVSRPCQGALKEALGANKLCAGQDLDPLVEPRKPRVAGTMLPPQGMKSLEKVRTTKRATTQDSRLSLPASQLNQHHLTSIHMTLERLNSLWLKRKQSNSVFLVSNKALIKPKRLALNSLVSNAKSHLLNNKNNLQASNRAHTIATAEILSWTNPIINLKLNLLNDQLECTQDLHQRCSKQIKKKGINFSNSIWEKSRKLQKETCSRIAHNSLATMQQLSILMAK